MKKIILFSLFFVAFFNGGFADSNCTKENIDKIQSCYNNAFGIDLSHSLGPYLWFGPLHPRNVTKEYWQPFCDKKQSLNNCIGKDIIESCFNIDTIKTIPDGLGAFITKAEAKNLIFSFILADLGCENLFKFTDGEYNCFKNNYLNIDRECRALFTHCDDFRKSFNCIDELTYKKCGKVVGCYERKYSQLLKCEDYDDHPFYCFSCDDISSTNNLIDGLCDNDDNRKSFVEIIIDQIQNLLSLNNP